eukprot:185647_1
MGGIRNVLTTHIKAAHEVQIEQLLNILLQETQPISVTEKTDNGADSPLAGHLPRDDHMQLHTTIASSACAEQVSLEQINRTITLNVERQQNKFVVYLNEQNDIWHWMLSEDKQDIADKLVQLTLHSKWVLAYLVFVFLLSFVCRFLIPMLQFLPAFLLVLYGITSFFTFNLDMTKRMLKSFIFWFKMYNWFVAIICYVIIFNADWSVEGMNWIAGTIIMADISLHDGWRLNKKLKIMGCFMVWIVALAIYIFVYFEGNSELFGGSYVFEDKMITFLGRTVSIKSNCLSALFNLLIFMGGQLIKMIASKDKSSVLEVRPNVIWVENWVA